MQLPIFRETPFLLQLSLSPVIENLERIAADIQHEGAEKAIALLEEVKPFPEFRKGFTDISQIEGNKKLIRKLLGDHFPEVLTLNEIKAISIPYRNFMFNRTQRFKNILRMAGPDFEFNIRDFDEHQFYILSCCLILNEFYGTQLDFSRPLFYDIPTADGIIRHYRIMYNADFMEISPTEKSVELTAEDIDNLMNNYDNLDLWKEKFPRESWLMKGFAIMTLYDATVENAVSLLKEKLLGLNNVRFRQNVESIFQSIYRIADLGVGFTLYLHEENKFKVAVFGQSMKSYILPDEEQQDSEDVLCMDAYRHLIKSNAYFSVSDTDQYLASNPESPLGIVLKSKNVKSFILAPVVKNGILLGILELVSPRIKELNSVNANKLSITMPFLTDSIERLVNEFQHQQQAVIQHYYTSIHASVYWKFKAEALRNLETLMDDEPYIPREVIFKDVFPLYGQIDIKGSSEARNSSVQIDLKNQLNELLHLIVKLGGCKAFEEERAQLNIFLEQLEFNILANTEQFILNYLETVLHPALGALDAGCFKQAIHDYFIETDKNSGSFYTYRRKYDKTISLINEKMALVIDKSQLEAQEIFPHYYERFKTDGVEHNLYIGSSIAPLREFTIEKLYALRFWQLKVLCKMEVAHHQLKFTLPYPMEVTSLILVYNSTISMRFRMDEKRFDVDGTYNARFEIVKKRIDKAYIKSSTQRITEAGKITIVYSSEAEEREYRGYIHGLHTSGMLDHEIEQFEVEDLQGISGLKALRVRILFPSSGTEFLNRYTIKPMK